MYDYKALRKIIRLLALLFGVVLVILIVTLRPLNPFGWISILFMAVVGIYLVSIPLKLLGEMQDMEKIIESYKKAAKQQGEPKQN